MLNYSLLTSVFPDKYSQVSLWWDESRSTLWVELNAQPIPCYNPALVQELITIAHNLNDLPVKPTFMVLCSKNAKHFNLGGDLAFFVQCIENNDRQKLTHYAHQCVELAYSQYSGFSQEILTISLIEGSALGGGFESALSCQFMLAQSNANMGLPEIAFNLFPGMGAYSFLKNKIGCDKTQQLLVSGQVSPAQHFKEIGVVDYCFEEGQGFEFTNMFIDMHRGKVNGIRAILKAKQIAAPISKSELIDITDIWVDYALKLPEENLAHMQKLVKLQQRSVKK